MLYNHVGSHETFTLLREYFTDTITQNGRYLQLGRERRAPYYNLWYCTRVTQHKPLKSLLLNSVSDLVHSTTLLSLLDLNMPSSQR